VQQYFEQTFAGSQQPTVAVALKYWHTRSPPQQKVLRPLPQDLVDAQHALLLISHAPVAGHMLLPHLRTVFDATQRPAWHVWDELQQLDPHCFATGQQTLLMQGFPAAQH
jgi:hypothetical protein